MSIKLSQKYGVNPAMNICFFCGETKELLLLGRLPGDEKAPREVCTNLEPCDVCKEKFKEGILIIEKNMRLNKVTGNYWLVSKDCINGEKILPKGVTYVTPEDAHSMGLYQ